LFIVIFPVALEPIRLLFPWNIATILCVPAPADLSLAAFILIFARPDTSVNAEPILLPLI